MGISVDIDTTAASKLLKDEGVGLMRDCAATAQEVAQKNARYRSGNMRRKIALVPTDDGAYVVGRDEIFIFHEYGTGEFAGDADAKYPDQRPSTGSEADEIPWVYMDDEGNFWTTTGVTPQPMLRPGYAAGKRHFEAERKRRGL